MEIAEYENIYNHQQTLWWYRGMATILHQLLSCYLPPNKKLKVLDAGCGTGAAFSFLRNFGTVTGVDISPEALRFAKRVGEKTKRGSVMRLPFQKASFDLVVSLDVLYHAWVKDYTKALAEYVRILKPGGILVWREPAFNWLKSGHDLVDFTQRRFTKEQMEKSLQDLPLKLKKTSYMNMILFPLVIIKRLPAIFHIEKPLPKSDINSLNPTLNNLLTYIFSLESTIITHTSLPIGSSVICIAQKYDKKNSVFNL